MVDWTRNLDLICDLSLQKGMATATIDILLGHLEALEPKGFAVEADIRRARELVVLLRSGSKIE